MDSQASPLLPRSSKPINPKYDGRLGAILVLAISCPAVISWLRTGKRAGVPTQMVFSYFSVFGKSRNVASAII